MVTAQALSAARAWFERRPWGRVIETFLRTSVDSYGAGLAFNAFVTLFPLTLGLLALLGLVVHDPGIEGDVSHVLLAAFPREAQPELMQALTAIRTHAWTLGLVSVAGLVWAGTGLFGSLEFVLNRVYGLPPRSFLRRRLTGLRLILVFAIAVMAAVAFNWTITSLSAYPPLAFSIGFVGGWLVMAAMLAWIYLVVPNRPMTLAEVLPGALVSGLGIEILSLVFPIFSRLTQRTNTYGAGLALIFVMLSWLYLISQLLLLGAVYNRVRSGGRVPDLQETPALALAKDAEGGGVQAQPPGLDELKA